MGKKPALIDRDEPGQTETWWVSGPPMVQEVGLKAIVSHGCGAVTLVEEDQHGTEKNSVLLSIQEFLRLAVIIQKSSLYEGGEKNHD